MSNKKRNKMALFTEVKDWIVRYYDKKDKQIGSHLIKERTEHEAEEEAIADMPYECEDWTLMPKTT
jgi:hemerythrin